MQSAKLTILSSTFRTSREIDTVARWDVKYNIFLFLINWIWRSEILWGPPITSYNSRLWDLVGVEWVCRAAPKLDHSVRPCCLGHCWVWEPRVKACFSMTTCKYVNPAPWRNMKEWISGSHYLSNQMNPSPLIRGISMCIEMSRTTFLQWFFEKMEVWEDFLLHELLQEKEDWVLFKCM